MRKADAQAARATQAESALSSRERRLRSRPANAAAERLDRRQA